MTETESQYADRLRDDGFNEDEINTAIDKDRRSGGNALTNALNSLGTSALDTGVAYGKQRLLGKQKPAPRAAVATGFNWKTLPWIPILIGVVVVAGLVFLLRPRRVTM